MARIRPTRAEGSTLAPLLAALLVTLAGCQSGGTPSLSNLWAKSHRPASDPLPADSSAAGRDDMVARGNNSGGGWLFTDATAGEARPEEEQKKDLFDRLDPQRIVKDVKSLAKSPTDRAAAEDLFRQAEEKFRHKEFAEAEDLYVQAAAKWPASAVERNSLFMIGETQFFRDQYPQAVDSYARLLKKYPHAPQLQRVVARQFAVARYWEQMEAEHPTSWYTLNLTDHKLPRRGTSGGARAIYNSIRMNDPTGTLADDAIMAIANHHFVRKKFNDADYYYDLLRREHPKSEHVFEAYLLGVQSKLHKYQGPDYDGTPLEEAEELIEDLRLQYPQQARDEYDRLTKIRQQIRRELARRDWHLAQYYDSGKNYGAARIYFQRIIEDYPLSEYAQQARARLGEIQDKPHNAPDYVPWLTEIFKPHEKRR